MLLGLRYSKLLERMQMFVRMCKHSIASLHIEPITRHTYTIDLVGNPHDCLTEIQGKCADEWHVLTANNGRLPPPAALLQACLCPEPRVACQFSDAI
jgi:hypothetical protein